MPEIKLSLQPKQIDAFEHCEKGKSQYLFYGGAKGGGKSYLVRAKELARRMTYAGTSGVIIRKTFPELLANHIRKFFVEYPFVKNWYKAGEKAIYYPNGSVTDFKYLAATDDVYNYQGIEYDDITLDEATQHEEEVFKILKTSLRVDPGVLKRNPGFKPCFLLTGNPGGIGHGWVKRLFIDRKFNPEENPLDHAFIQAKIFDNPVFVRANPQYLKNLEDLPPDLRRAYLDGDWNIFIGQFFTDFRRDIHVIEPFPLDPEWTRVFALDWGYSPHPFHAAWYAIDEETKTVYKYREFEGFETSPEDVAKGILKLTDKQEIISTGFGDTQMWASNPFARQQPDQYANPEQSIAMQINRILQSRNMHMRQANKDRIHGWTNLKVLMKWEGNYVKSGLQLSQSPRFYIFSTCKSTVGAYPNQIHNELKPGDMLKQNGDDPCDTDRYAVMGMVMNQIIPEVVTHWQIDVPRKKTVWEEAYEQEYPDLIWAEREPKDEYEGFY